MARRQRESEPRQLTEMMTTRRPGLRGSGSRAVLSSEERRGNDEEVPAYRPAAGAPAGTFAPLASPSIPMPCIFVEFNGKPVTSVKTAFKTADPGRIKRIQVYCESNAKIPSTTTAETRRP